MKQRHVRHVGRVVVLAIVMLLVNLPLIVTVLGSFKSTEEITSTSTLWPQEFTVAAYSRVNTATDFTHFVLSSIIVSVSCAALVILVAALAGYVLSRSAARPVAAFGRMLLVLQMFPVLLAMIPLFLLFKNFQLIDTYASVIVINTAVLTPYSTWLFKGYFDTIPMEVEESAWIDGCSRFAALQRVVFPLSGPGAASVGIFAFLVTWNEFLIASVFLRSPDRFTIPLGIQSFIQNFRVDWAALNAASVLALIPAAVFIVFAQRYMVSGTISGSVKG